MITYIIAGSYQDYAAYCKENKIDPNEPIFVRDVKNFAGIDVDQSKFVFTKMASNHPQHAEIIKLVEGIISIRRRGHHVHEEVLASDSGTSN